MKYFGIVKTSRELGQLMLRLSVVIVIWPHGAQKVLGWFGGYGFSNTYNAFTENMGIWGPMAVAAILTEFLAPFFLLIGFLTRPAALALAVLMLVAMSYHWQNGFFINWAGKAGAGEGVEFHLLFIGAALSILLAGPGKISLDHCLMRKFCREALPDEC